MNARGKPRLQKGNVQRGSSTARTSAGKKPDQLGDGAKVEVPAGWEEDGWEVVERDGVSYLTLPEDKLLGLGSGFR